MKGVNSSLFRFFAVLLLAVVQLALPRSAHASSGQCNLFCWFDCSSIEGQWCGAGCGAHGLTCTSAGICGEHNLVTVSCFQAEE
jgi:hypothetical protein